MREDDFFECYVCGKPALYVIEIAGEDEVVSEEAACAVHARAHVHRALLTPLANASAPAPDSRP